MPTKSIEESARSLLEDVLNRFDVEHNIASNDKTPIVDGFLKYENKQLDVQLKGTAGEFANLSIEKKYFMHAFNNNLLYIIVSNIDDGIRSENYKIHYTFLSAKEASLFESTGNKLSISVNKLPFHVLQDKTKFLENYSRYYKIEKGKITNRELSDLMLSNKIDKFNFKGIINTNTLDVKSQEIKSIVTKSGFEIGVVHDEGLKFYTDIVASKEDDFIIQDSGIVMKVKRIPNLNIVNFEYKNVLLSFSYNGSGVNLKYTLNDLGRFSVLRTEEYINYYKIIEYFCSVVKDDNFNIDMFEALKKYHDWSVFVNQNNLGFEKFDSDTCVNYIVESFEKGLKYIEDREEIIVINVNNHVLLRTNYRDKKNTIIGEINGLSRVEYAGGRVIVGYLAMLTEYYSNYRQAKILNYNYRELFENDLDNMDQYSTYEMNSIILNYLNVHWHNKYEDNILEIVYTYLKDSEYLNDKYIKMNFLQIKKILSVNFTDEEFDFIMGLKNSEDELEYIYSLIMLEEKLVLKRKIEEASKETLEEIAKYPILNLMNEITK